MPSSNKQQLFMSALMIKEIELSAIEEYLESLALSPAPLTGGFPANPGAGEDSSARVDAGTVAVLPVSTLS